MSNGWLWSDQLFIGLLLTVFILSLYGLRKTNHRLVMHRFFQKPIAVSSSMILFFFLAIGVLDSKNLFISFCFNPLYIRNCFGRGNSITNTSTPYLSIQ